MKIEYGGFVITCPCGSEAVMMIHRVGYSTLRGGGIRMVVLRCSDCGRKAEIGHGEERVFNADCM